MKRKAKAKSRKTEVPHPLELHPHVWCDPINEQYVVEGKEQTEEIGKHDFAVLTALTLAVDKLVEVDELVRLVYNDSKKEYLSANRRNLAKNVIYEINHKILTLHGAKIIRYNKTLDAYQLVPPNRCEVCLPALVRKPGLDVKHQRKPTKPGPLQR